MSAEPRSTTKASLNLLLQRNKDGTLNGPSLPKRLGTYDAQAARKSGKIVTAADGVPMPPVTPERFNYQLAAVTHPSLSGRDLAPLGSVDRAKSSIQPYTDTADSAFSALGNYSSNPYVKGLSQFAAVPLAFGSLADSSYNAKEVYEDARLDPNKQPALRSWGKPFNEVDWYDRVGHPTVGVTNTIADAAAQAGLVGQNALKSNIYGGAISLAPNLVNTALSRNADEFTNRAVQTGSQAAGLAGSAVISRGLAAAAPAAGVLGRLAGPAMLPILAGQAVGSAYNTINTSPDQNEDGLRYRAVQDQSGAPGRVFNAMTSPIQAGKQSDRLGGVFNPGFWYDTVAGKDNLSSAGEATRGALEENAATIKRHRDIHEDMKQFVLAASADPTSPLKDLPKQTKQFIGHRIALLKQVGENIEPVSDQALLKDPELYAKYKQTFENTASDLLHAQSAMDGSREITNQQLEIIDYMLKRYGLNKDLALLAATEQFNASSNPTTQLRNKELPQTYDRVEDFVKQLNPRR